MLQYVKKLFALNTSTWTPFNTTIPCNSIVFRNTASVAVNFRTDQNDANTQDTLQPNDQEIIPASVRIARDAYIFGSNVTVGYWQLSTGTAQNITVTMFSE